ncbi:uncharacterized protein SKDI_12G2640 [Saccharomyces kudriavzevii IFO 1802]|uniref:Uncharacterized protein n=1 Tax=Saccharomyces kudriavzevii (strain ATCC MYA-4449 / AS 2.2408 / CBS 8840 / NBRC 1802 / NCYC 2889) TaxID=226230 RepID=A0AA35J2L3_SACK1|nr:uncharacterized protein SKDI_12G2640 [Saccharomyces kudriavzevii IFO 1802]CAI4046476.1 hypothetical protein SKDI_12G2640 [Saccharomyces kudriavzevii IFO 1802]
MTGYTFGLTGMPTLVYDSNNTLDIPTFMDCLGPKETSSVTLYTSSQDNQFYLTNTNNVRIVNHDLWSKCLRDQGVDTELWLAPNMYGLDDVEHVTTSTQMHTFN